MENIIYVTGNPGKKASVKKIFEKRGLDITIVKYDFHESDVNDIEAISREKAKEAYDMLGKPCFVADSGFYIDDYPDNPGYPGAFVKRSGVSSDIEGLLEKMKNKKNRSCKFIDCLTFYDGNDYYNFYGESRGTIAYDIRGNGTNSPTIKSNLWYVFIPDNHNKTLAEMTEEERENRHDGHTSATEIFADWYINNYCKNNKIIFSKKFLKIKL